MDLDVVSGAGVRVPRLEHVPLFSGFALRPGTNPGTGTAYHPTALHTVGPYELPVPGFENVPLFSGLNLRTTTSQKCEAVPRRARM